MIITLGLRCGTTQLYRRQCKRRSRCFWICSVNGQYCWPFFLVHCNQEYYSWKMVTPINLSSKWLTLLRSLCHVVEIIQCNNVLEIEVVCCSAVILPTVVFSCHSDKIFVLHASQIVWSGRYKKPNVVVRLFQIYFREIIYSLYIEVLSPFLYLFFMI
jgi:hypothetical protein